MCHKGLSFNDVTQTWGILDPSSPRCARNHFFLNPHTPFVIKYHFWFCFTQKIKIFQTYDQKRSIGCNTIFIVDHTFKYIIKKKNLLYSDVCQKRVHTNALYNALSTGPFGLPFIHFPQLLMTTARQYCCLAIMLQKKAYLFSPVFWPPITKCS